MSEMSTFARHLKNSFVQGSLIFTTATFIGSFLNYIFSLVVANKLGPVGFGEVTTLFSYTTIFSVPMAVSNMVIIQKIGSNSERGLSYALTLERWFYEKLKKRGLLLLPLLFMTPLIQRLTNLSFYSSASIVPFVALSFIAAYYSALLQGLHLFVWLSTLSLVAIAIKLVGAFSILSEATGILNVVIFLFISLTMMIIGSFFVMRKVGRGHEIIQSKLKKRVLRSIFQRHVLITFISVLGLTLFGNADIVTAKKFLSPEQAGTYSSWSLFAKIILYIIGPLLTVSYIFFSSLKNKQNHEKVLNLSLLILGVVAIGSFLFYQYLSLPIINLLFGQKFNAIAPSLGLASIFGSIYTAIMLLNNYFLSKKSYFSVFPIAANIVYIPSLYFFGTSIWGLIAVNLSVGTALLLLQIWAMVKYNTDNGNKD